VASVWMQCAGGPHNLVFAPRRRSRTSNPVQCREPEALIEIDFIDASNQSWFLANPPWFPATSSQPSARCVPRSGFFDSVRPRIQSTVTS
jgi:hypothetical protein